MPSPSRHPKGLYVLFFTEMWERFGYYLMLGILFLYMTDNLKGGLGFDDARAHDIYGTYIALVYLTPFLGGLLADRIFGYRKTIIAGGTLMALGYLTLSLPGETPFYIALFLVITGNGLFKPNISTLLGNLYNQQPYRELKDKGYNIFYMGINIGALVCNFVAAYMRNHYGWGYAFAAAGIGMLIGLGIFLSKMKSIKDADVIKPANPEDMSMKDILGIIFLPAIVFALLGLFLPGFLGAENFLGSKSNDAFLFACIPVTFFYIRTYWKANAEDKKPVGSLLYIFFVVIVFWAIFHQNGNVLTEWTEKNTDREISDAMVPLLKSFGMVQEVTAEPIPTVQKDEFGKIMLRENGDTVKTETYNKYLLNLPKKNWPSEGKTLNLISTEIFQSVNPCFVVLFTPLVLAFFSLMAGMGRKISTPAKIAWGLTITGLSTLVMVAAVSASGNGMSKVSPLWVIGSYAVITVGELFLSPMGLSLVSKLSPQRITALMMGGWFLSTSIGNKLSGVLGHIGTHSDDKSLVFWLNFAGAMLAALLLFLFVKKIKKVVRDKTGMD